MKRRDTLKTLLTATAGVTALPSWAIGWSKNTWPTDPSWMSSDQTDILIALADCIIPAEESGGEPGAVELGVHQFLIRLFRDCYSEEIQEELKTLLDSLNSNARESFSQTFDVCNQGERQTLFTALLESEKEGQFRTCSSHQS